MYYKIKFNHSVKINMENVFDNNKKTFSFSEGDIIEGRIDKIRGKLMLVTEDGYGGIINTDSITKI